MKFVYHVFMVFRLPCSPSPIFAFQEHKAKVVQLEEQVAKVKTRYSVALRNLEQISEQIHAQRGYVCAGGGGRRAACGGRSSPVGAEAETGVAVRVPIGRFVGKAEAESAWLDGERTRLWVEKHRRNGWGQREEAEAFGTGSDRVSVVSLQTVGSDLEKCDSVEHLSDLSDGGSAPGEEWDWNRKTALRPGKEALGPRRAKARRQNQTGSPEKQDGFVKQHHRSVSL